MSDFDYATPYDIMVGLWAGLAVIYDHNGRYQGATPSRVAVYWKNPKKLMHFRADETDSIDDLLKGQVHGTAVTKLVHLEYDLHITGKSGTGGTKTTKVMGIQSRPDVYHFHLKSDGGHWYNNHVFPDPNERHVVGPFVPAKSDGVSLVVAQTFTRISYDVPKKFRRELR